MHPLGDEEAKVVVHPGRMIAVRVLARACQRLGSVLRHGKQERSREERAGGEERGRRRCLLRPVEEAWVEGRRLFLPGHDIVAFVISLFEGHLRLLLLLLLGVCRRGRGSLANAGGANAATAALRVWRRGTWANGGSRWTVFELDVTLFNDARALAEAGARKGEREEIKQGEGRVEEVSHPSERSPSSCQPFIGKPFEKEGSPMSCV